MPKTKISEFSATPANNTDIDSINIAEGCAPSGINDAIRELMAQLKDFQTGAVGDSFNGPIGTSTAAAGAFTTLSASSTTTLSGLTASTALALDVSKNVVSVTNTGTGSNVLATSPTLVTPALGTPSALVGTNITGTASGLTAGNVTTNANLTGAVTSVGNATSLGSFSSANLLGALTDETGTGSAVFATSPTLVTPILGTPTSATLTNATGLPIATGVSGLGTGVATALAINVGSSGAPLVNGGVLGTPSSGTATNLTGLPLTTGVTGTLPTANGGTNLTSFTSGGVVYASSTSALATGSALQFNGTGLSIGTTTVDERLRINGSTDATSRVRLFNQGTELGAVGSQLGYLGSGGANDMLLYGVSNTTIGTNGFVAFTAGGVSEQMRLTSTGLGIGTSSPAYKLHAVKTGGGILGRFDNADGVADIYGYGLEITRSVAYIKGSGALQLGGANGYNDLVINSSGNVGIGTSSPTQVLDIQKSQAWATLTSTTGTLSSLFKSSNTGGSSYFGRDNSTGGVLGSSAYATVVYGSGAYPMTFHTNDTERARIDSSGNLLVGTTSADAKVTVGTAANQRSIQLNATDSSTFTDVIIYANGYRNTTNGSWKYLSCAINGVGEKLQIIDSGTVNNATGTYGTISDARLKQDIVDAPSQWSDIKAIRFRKYRMKLDVESNPNAPTMLGVVAQELELVSPNLVDESNNEDGTTTKTVKQSILLMKAAVALQEAMTRIEQLEARLDAVNL